MKDDQKQYGSAMRGKCLVCGKPTNTGNHLKCSEYAIEARAIAERQRKRDYDRSYRAYKKGKTLGVVE